MNYVLYGEEQFLLQKALNKIVEQHSDGVDALNTVTYDATHVDIQTIMEDAMTIPFFADHKLIVVRNATFLSTNNDSNIDTAILDKYLDEPMESTVLVFIGNFEKLDARKKIVKKIQKVCKVMQFRKLDLQGKQIYIQDEIRRRSLTIDKNAVEDFIKRASFDIRSIRSELDKLELFGEVITKDIVAKLVTRPLEEDVFLLVNAVVDRDLRKAFALWHDLCVLNKDAIFLIALLASQFRFLYEVKAFLMQGMNKEQITGQLHAHPYRVQMSMQQAQRLDIGYLLDILQRLATLDQKLKSGKLDKKLGFEMFLLELQGEN